LAYPVNQGKRILYPSIDRHRIDSEQITHSRE